MSVLIGILVVLSLHVYRRGQSITKPVGDYHKIVPFGAEEMKPVESMAAHIPLERPAEPTAADSAKEASFPWTSTTTVR